MSRKRGIIIGLLAAIIIAAMGICGRMAVRQDREMHAALDSLLEQNRSYVPFTTDSVARRVAAYFDHPLHFWTTSNDRLRAHYALGSVYRDLHEAPAALLAWEDGIAAADTTSKDCDFATLTLVYGQMADVYFRQYMAEDALKSCELYSHFALQSGDTLMYIKGLLQRNDAYLALGDTAAIFANIDSIRNLYLERGLNKEAAQVYQMAIYLAVEQKKHMLADSLMRIFERESGLFDTDGIIIPTRTIYHSNRGRFFLNLHELDSAENNFRKLLGNSSTLIDGYRGLIMLYHQKHDADSVFKYAHLYEDALDNYLKASHTSAIALAEGMYDYSRQQQIARIQSDRTNKWKLVSFLTLIVILLLALYHQRERHRRRTKEQELNQKTKDYNEALNNLKNIQDEISRLREVQADTGKLNRLLEEQGRELHRQEALVKDLRQQLINMAELTEQKNQEESEILAKFHEMTIAHRVLLESGKYNIVNVRAANMKEWQELLNIVRVNHPSFYLFINKYSLSDFRFRVCVLSRLGFKSHEMATILDCKENSVSNARKELAKILFGLESARDLDKKLIEI